MNIPFTASSKSASIKTYASYANFKDNNPAISEQATYSYTIVSDGTTALKFSISNKPYVVKINDANSIEVYEDSTSTGISKFASKVV